MLDVELKHLSVNRPFDNHRNLRPIESQRANDGNISTGQEVSFGSTQPKLASYRSTTSKISYGVPPL
jgi:hypothetical protein